MGNLIINGGKPLTGTIQPSGNKNSVLPILCATLLTDEPVILRNVPEITDVHKLIEFFEALGSEITWDRSGNVVRICHANASSTIGRAKIPQGMRSSVLLFAPLLHRLGRLEVDSSAKGCSLGIRELDPHLEILNELGASVEHNGTLELKLPGRFRGSHFWQDYMSVTTTENFVMAAAVAKGESEVVNAASEPHVQDLCRFLVKMGAQIDGIGTSVLRVQGVDSLSGTEATISSDHHEIATFLALGAITGGEVRVGQVARKHFTLINRSFEKLGVHIEYEGDDVALVRPGQPLVIREPYTSNLLPKIEAAPWPYFPVDLLPLMVALAAKAKGAIQFWNKVYEGGFQWTPEMVKFGAHVVASDPHRIIVFGGKPLRPAIVESPYIIRAAVALYMAAASIEGQSVVKNAAPIRRAHPHFVENLQRLGADVEWDEPELLIEPSVEAYSLTDNL